MRDILQPRAHNLADDAWLWFLQVQQDEGTPTWHHFTKLLHLRFGSLPVVTIVLANMMRRLQEDMDRVTMMINRVCAQLEKSRHERLVAVRLQAVARGFLVRHATRKLRVAIQPALLTPDHHLQSLLPPSTLVVVPTTPTRGSGKSF